MKRLILLFAVIFIANISVCAKDVPIDKAKQLAINFYYQRINLIKSTDYNEIEINESILKTENDIVTYYAFNFEKGGFILIAADDAVIPVLGYSFEGGYNTENQPPQFKYWIDNYSKQILYCKQNKISATQKIFDEWNKLLIKPSVNSVPKDIKTVLPLITANWEQSYPYNAMCPIDSAGNGDHVLVGCVAIAMAQVMHYYKYPIQGTGSYSYNDVTYGNLTADFGNSTYDWYGMPNSVITVNFSVAQLLYHCGISVETFYGANSSAAYTENVDDALLNYFNYSSAQFVSKDTITDSIWENMLKSNLDAKQPIFYAGNGHAFNCDGYQGSDYFHFNWGWGGIYNGYYYINNLNPAGYNFSAWQEAVVNIYPGSDYPFYCNGKDTITAAEGLIDDGSGVTNYQDNIDCEWLIAPSEDIASITLTFDRFETENGQDIVTVYDGDSTNATVLGVFSGSLLPPSITSTSDKMLIRFTTNGNTNSSGWLASFKSNYFDFCDNYTIMTGTSDTLSDGSGSRDYNNNTFCRWSIQPPGVNSITLNFTSFSTESINDYVRIYDASQSPMSILGEFSGTTIPLPVTCNSGIMLVWFRTNDAIRKDGWTATYTSTPTEIHENIFFDDISIYPNPTGDYINVYIKSKEKQKMQIYLLTTTGICIYTEDIPVFSGEMTRKIFPGECPKGAYLLKFITNENVVNKIIVVE